MIPYLIALVGGYLIGNATTTKFKKGSIIRSGDISKRKSPSVSATAFAVGHIERGNDGNLWQIVKDSRGVQRWQRIMGSYDPNHEREKIVQALELLKELRKDEFTDDYTYEDNKKRIEELEYMLSQYSSGGQLELDFDPENEIDESTLKAMKFIELQNKANQQIEALGEVEEDLAKELEDLGNSLNSHEVELVMEMYKFAKGGEIKGLSSDKMKRYVQKKFKVQSSQYSDWKTLAYELGYHYESGIGWVKI